MVINLHITERCNYRCNHCFGHFDSRRDLSLSEWKSVVDAAMEKTSVKRFNLAGREPLLFSGLDELIDHISGKGAAVSIITNGSLLDDELLQSQNIAMIGISVDSFCEATLRKMGRCQRNGTVLLKKQCRRLCERILANNITLKINTVVTRLNLHEDFSPMTELAPQRWKLLKMQPFKSAGFDNAPLGISAEEFDAFCSRQRLLGIGFTPEASMRRAYIFVDPAGNLVDNSAPHYKPIGNLLTEDFFQVFQRLPFNTALYQSRYEGGINDA